VTATQRSWPSKVKLVRVAGSACAWHESEPAFFIGFIE